MKLKTIPPYPGTGPVIRAFQLPTAEIGYVTSMVEAYDGIGLVRTLDEARGIIECWVMPDFMEAWDRLIAALGEEFPIQELPAALD